MITVDEWLAVQLMTGAPVKYRCIGTGEEEQTNKKEFVENVFTRWRDRYSRKHGDCATYGSNTQDTKTTLSRVESTLGDVLERTTKLEQQVVIV